MRNQIDPQDAAEHFNDPKIDAPTIKLWRQVEDINHIYNEQRKGMDKQQAKNEFERMETNLDRARELAFQSEHFRAHVVGNKPSKRDADFAMELSGYIQKVHEEHQERVQEVFKGAAEAFKDATDAIEDAQESLQDAQDLLGGDSDDGLF